MPSPAVPNTDLPGPDLPDTEVNSGPADDAARPSATLLHCDGCGARALINQDEHHYGGLVHGFLGQHSGCGKAVQITRIRAGDS